ncbi:hypothetical protein D7030_07910 [Flavobacteriaceae bacterium AU392]|nr:hypothetical protein D1817_00505 [Flavobacteriaceae bacterium]RKM85048.1 hypothetical protein D7030_07910 [Flavobacteriaceae bacterium AU392]
MLPFRTEIRNSPREQTIKIYLTDITLDNEIKSYLQDFDDIRMIEIRDSVGRNRVSENITIFRNENVDINVLKEVIDDYLTSYFEK